MKRLSTSVHVNGDSSKTANRSFQLIDGGKLPAEIRKSVHTQLFELGHGPREVGRRYALRDAEAVQTALEVEREAAQRMIDRAYRAGLRDARFSPLPPTGRAA